MAHPAISELAIPDTSPSTVILTSLPSVGE